MWVMCYAAMRVMGVMFLLGQKSASLMCLTTARLRTFNFLWVRVEGSGSGRILKDFNRVSIWKVGIENVGIERQILISDPGPPWGLIALQCVACTRALFLGFPFVALCSFDLNILTYVRIWDDLFDKTFSMIPTNYSVSRLRTASSSSLLQFMQSSQQEPCLRYCTCRIFSRVLSHPNPITTFPQERWWLRRHPVEIRSWDDLCLTSVHTPISEPWTTSRFWMNFWHSTFCPQNLGGKNN